MELDIQLTSEGFESLILQSQPIDSVVLLVDRYCCNVSKEARLFLQVTCLANLAVLLMSR